jgi:hypothetical protein
MPVVNGITRFADTSPFRERPQVPEAQRERNGKRIKLLLGDILD